MSEDILQTPGPGVNPATSPRPERFARVKLFIGLRKRPDGMPPFIWAERWNAFIIGAAIAIGVPLLGWSGLSMCDKWMIAALWWAISHPFFVHFERREVVGQMEGRGSLDAAQATEQQDTAQNPYWGVIGAIIVWLLVFGIHIAIKVFPQYESFQTLIVRLPAQMYASFWDAPVHYGLIEWGILAHTWIVTKLSNKMTYNEINQFNQATPRATRSERRVPTND